MFSTLYGTYFSFSMHFTMSSATCFNLDWSKILSSGTGLMLLSMLFQIYQRNQCTYPRFNGIFLRGLSTILTSNENTVQAEKKNTVFRCQSLSHYHKIMTFNDPEFKAC